MNKASIKQIDGRYLVIDVSQEPLKSHFENPYNYVKEICQQFNDDFYKDIITPDDKVILNLGANIGLFDVHVSPYAKKIISVEPTPSHFEILKLITSRLPHETHLENIAIAEYNGEIEFYFCEINSTMNSLHNRWGKKQKVPCATVMTMVEKYGDIDLLKIDCEGGENQFITPELVKGIKNKVKKIWMECHPPDSETQEKFTKIFEGEGYTVTKFHNDSLLCK